MKRKISCLVSMLSLAGCNALPSMPDDRPEDIVKLADLIECEILAAFKGSAKTQLQNFDDWAATYTITQNATNTAGAGIDAIKWIAPAGVNRLIFDADAGVSREAYRWGRAEYTVRVKNEKSHACERAKTYKDVLVSPSDFRLSDWINQVGRSENQLKSMGYTVRVTVTSSAGIGGDFADKKWTAVGGIAGKRVSVRTVDFTFSQIPKPPQPTKVIVVAPIPGSGPFNLNQLNPTLQPRTQSTAPPRGPVSKPSSSTLVPDAAVQQNRGIQQLQRLEQLPDF